jgi:hypothetical protein
MLTKHHALAVHGLMNAKAKPQIIPTSQQAHIHHALDHINTILTVVFAQATKNVLKNHNNKKSPLF